MMEPGIETLDLDGAISRHGDNIVDWVNELLDPLLPDSPTASIAGSIGDLGNLDKTIVNLIARFDVIAQETASRLDTTIADVTRTMPRLNFDVQVMREAALSLQSALHTLQSNSATNSLFPPSNTETTTALERLHTLSLTHSNMSAAYELLKKAEAWSTLESDVTRLLANAEFDAAADRLATSSLSLSVFENTPEYENAKSLMTSLQNQLEAGLSTAVVNAVNKMDLDGCKRYYLIFGRIQRESEFKYYYNGIRRAGLVKLWASEETDAFSRFFSEFMGLVNVERQNMLRVYPNAQECLVDFISTTVEALSPSLSQRLEVLRDIDGFPALVEALGVVREFVSAASKTLEAMLLFSPGQSTTGQSTTKSGSMLLRKPSHSRRASKRFSISQREGAPKSLKSSEVEVEVVPPWELALLEPFLEHQSDYGHLELKLLQHDLALKSHKRTASQDGAKRLMDTLTDAIQLAEDAVPRCVAFTHTYGASELVSAIDHFCADVFETCRVECIPSAAATTPVAVASVPDEDLDYTPEDWSTFQLALRLLESCRAAQDRLDALESRIQTRLVQAHKVQSHSRTRAEIQLLERSALNTDENRSLLVRCEGEGAGGRLLVRTWDGHGAFTRACQALVRDTILSPLKLRLAGYASLSEWSQPDPSGGTLKLPTFSTSATRTIQTVAEGLLNLPRLFEVYADDNALAFSLATLPFVQQEEEEDGVTGMWLVSLTMSLCAHVTDVVLPQIAALTPLGARQLAADLEYLCNVVRTLGVEPELLERWRAAADTSDADGATRDDVFMRVAALRGW